MSGEKRKLPSYDSSLCCFNIMGDDGYEHMYFPQLLLAAFENEADGRKGYNIWINLSHLEDDGEIDHYCYLTLNVDELVTPKNAAYVNPVYSTKRLTRWSPYDKINRIISNHLFNSVCIYSFYILI